MSGDKSFSKSIGYKMLDISESDIPGINPSVFSLTFPDNWNPNLKKKLNMKIKIVNESVYQLPKYATEGSVGMDLQANIIRPLLIRSNHRDLIPTGLFVEIPLGYEIQIRPRSGLAAKCGVSVLNTPGTIDSDYRGEIKVILINLGVSDFVVNPGDKIAQMICCPIIKIELEQVENRSKLTDTTRNAGGFGSTDEKKV